MLLAIVSSNSTVSCVTMPICARSEASVTSRMSTPSMRMRARADVVEPRQQVDERRLARAAAADDRDHLPGAARVNDTPRRIRPGPRRSRSRRRGTRSRRRNGASAAAPRLLVHLGVRVEHLEDPLGRGDRLLQVGVHAAQLLRRPVHQEQRGDERRELARASARPARSAGCRTTAPPAMPKPPSSSISGGRLESAAVTFMLVRNR